MEAWTFIYEMTLTPKTKLHVVSFEREEKVINKLWDESKLFVSNSTVLWIY